MCGLIGIAGTGRERAPAMLARLAHRGPDARGVLALDEVDLTLGHVRLAILDLDPRSNQPFRSACGRHVLVFNGEIYNFVELRRRLEASGTAFRTTSDTEVLLAWLIEHGTRGLVDLDGMFAFAWVDLERRELVLARDALGEKPLYWAAAPGAFAFASEPQALLELPGVDTGVDGEALADFTRFLYTAAPRTLYRGIRELSPGSFARIDLSRAHAAAPRVERWYDLESRAGAPEPVDREESLSRFRAAFAESLRLRLRSDVPVGVFLSGGLDSNAILGVARELERELDLQAFTVGFAGSAEARSRDEAPLAARAAAAQRASHRSLAFVESSDLAAGVERVVDMFGAPFGNATAVIADQLAGLAARSVKVCLAGDGGDEIAVGYPRYKALPWHARLSRAPLAARRALAASCRWLGESGRHATPVRRMRAFASALGRPTAESFLDWSTYVGRSDLERALGREGPTAFDAGLQALFERHAHDPIRAAELVDLVSFVPFNLMQAADRTSMAHGLELRVPFLSPRLVEAALSIPTAHKLARGRSKPLLADALGDAIPPFVRGRKKRPFNPPMEGFVRKHLGGVAELIGSPRSELSAHVSNAFVRDELAAFARGERDNSTWLFGMATLEVWLGRRKRAPVRSAEFADAYGK